MAKGSRRKKVRYRTAEWEGETYRLAVLDKGIILSDEDKIQIAELVCKMYATDKYSLICVLTLTMNRLLKFSLMHLTSLLNTLAVGSVF